MESRFTEQLVEENTEALASGVGELLKRARLLTAIGDIEDRTWAPYARNIEDSLQAVARILGRTRWNTTSSEPETHEQLLTRAMNERRLVRVFYSNGNTTKVRIYESYGWRYRDGETRSHVWVWNVDNQHPEMLKVGNIIGVELLRQTFEPRITMYESNNGGK